MHLETHCISNMGKALVREISLQTNAGLITLLLNRTAEMREILASGLPFPASAYPDTTRELGLLKIENSVLNEEQLMRILELAHKTKEVYQFFKNRKGVFINLEEIISGTQFEFSIIKEIENILDENGQVRTNASVELARIRKSLQRNRAEADRIYHTVINRYRKLGWLTESEESSRNGRRVIAIFSEQKRAARGIIHDSSTSGKTAFVEPEEVLGINNIIASLEIEEQQEITRILRELASVLRKYVPQMQIYSHQLGLFDLNRAKGLHAIEIDGSLPKINADPVIGLKNARHPILYLHNKHHKKPTIPFDLSLGGDERILVISGPNAGGKTVCMKTAGLLQMMFQSGMLVSAHADSTFGIFENLLVDIGDSQSIEYELSTYSSRLRHMRIFLERVNAKSLFLIDEFGTGTDPDLGGALAEAVLESLNDKKSFGIITTHYLNLKVMADRTPGIINGSMEFDLKKLRPLYRLSLGKPGSSYTFLVAERSGLPHELVRNARKKVARKKLMLEKLLTDVERKREQLKSKSEELELREKELRELIIKNLQLSKNTEQTYSKKEEKLKKHEEKISKESETTFREFLKEWKKSKDKKSVMDKYYRKFVRKQKIEDPAVTARKKEQKMKEMKAIIKPGVRVRLVNGSTTGIVDQVDNTKAHVIFGQFKTVCEIINLEVVDEKTGK